MNSCINDKLSEDDILLNVTRNFASNYANGIYGSNRYCQRFLENYFFNQVNAEEQIKFWYQKYETMKGE